MTTNIPAEPTLTTTSKVDTSTPSNVIPFRYKEIQKVVWAFADMCRDKGQGTVEDYAKIVLPTCLFKRILDLQEEYVANEAQGLFKQVSMGLVSEKDALIKLNSQGYKFFDVVAMQAQGVPLSAMLITWKDLMEFKGVSNDGETEFLGKNGLLAFNQKFESNSKSFIDLMAALINVLSPTIRFVFKEFEYVSLVKDKGVIPFADFSETCHNELTKFKFDTKNISFDLFGDMYMDLTGRFAVDAGKKGGEFFTETSLVKAAWQFADIDDYADKLLSGEKTMLSIGDPTSGSNTFLVSGFDLVSARMIAKNPNHTITKDNFSFYGQELKTFQYCLGLMNMVFHNTADRYNVEQGTNFELTNANVINDYANGIGRMRQKLDIVVANPPYGTKNYGIEFAQQMQAIDPRWKYGVPSKSEGEFAFLMTIYDLLNKTGKAVVVMPLGTLFRNGGKNIRKQLMEEDVVEGIVTLPANMFLTTSIPVCLWILNRNKKEADKGKIFMVNATSDFTKKGKFNEWHSKTAIDAYLSRTAIEDYSGYVDLATLEANKFNFSVPRYFSKVAEKEIVDITELEGEIEELEATLVSKKSVLKSLMGQVLKLETENDSE